MTDAEESPEAADSAVAGEVALHWRRFVTAGVIAVILGAIAIAVPPLASVAIEILVGWLLIAAGGFLIGYAFSYSRGAQVVVRLLWAALSIAAGIYLLASPLEGTITLTVVLSVYFIAAGIVRVGAAFAERGIPGAGLVGVSGALSLIIGVLILAELPSSAAWAIGLLVGIDLVFAGWALISTGLAGKSRLGAS